MDSLQVQAMAIKSSLKGHLSEENLSAPDDIIQQNFFKV